MKTPAFGLPTLVLATLLLLPSSSQAQYMYLDSNGDGVHSSADVLHGTGPTVVDIWLDTAHNRDGSTTHCSAGTAQPLSMFSYEVTLEATDGTAVFSSFTNRLIQFAHVVGGRSDGSHFYTGAYSTTAGIVKAPGRYLLGTFNVNVDGGTPSIRMVPTWPGSPSEFTEFGSECDGTQFPNSMMFETDWFDADGLAFEAGGGGKEPASFWSWAISSDERSWPAHRICVSTASPSARESRASARSSWQSADSLSSRDRSKFWSWRAWVSSWASVKRW